jgi:hypothetical protein
MATAPIFGEIYVHMNVSNGKSYVGQTTVGMAKRWAGHIKERRNRVFSHAIRKYGVEFFAHQVLSVASSQEQLDNLEKLWIILLQTKTPNGYNLTNGGEAGTLGYRHTPESLALITAASAGRKASPVTREKLSKIHIGKKMPRSGVEKMAASKRGKKQSSETIAKRSAAMSKVMLGKKKSDSHRRNIGLAQKGKKQTAERKANTSKVMQAWWDARKKVSPWPAA